MNLFCMNNSNARTHNQLSIANSGGIEPMLNLLHSDNAAFQHCAARVLYCLVANEVKFTPLILYFGQLCTLPFRNNIDITSVIGHCCKHY